jgi:p-aminobenzoyl-glutamate transporter AbgT
MKSFPLFLAGFAPGAGLGMLSALNLSRASARIAASAPHAPLSLTSGLARRTVLVLAAFWLGSRFGVAGLLGSFAGVLAGFSAVIVVRTREASHG